MDSQKRRLAYYTQTKGHGGFEYAATKLVLHITKGCLGPALNCQQDLAQLLELRIKFLSENGAPINWNSLSQYIKENTTFEREKETIKEAWVKIFRKKLSHLSHDKTVQDIFSEAHFLAHTVPTLDLSMFLHHVSNYIEFDANLGLIAVNSLNTTMSNALQPVIIHFFVPPSHPYQAKGLVGVESGTLDALHEYFKTIMERAKYDVINEPSDSKEISSFVYHKLISKIAEILQIPSMRLLGTFQNTFERLRGYLTSDVVLRRARTGVDHERSLELVESLLKPRWQQTLMEQIERTLGLYQLDSAEVDNYPNRIKQRMKQSIFATDAASPLHMVACTKWPSNKYQTIVAHPEQGREKSEDMQDSDTEYKDEIAVELHSFHHKVCQALMAAFRDEGKSLWTAEERKNAIRKLDIYIKNGAKIKLEWLNSKIRDSLLESEDEDEELSEEDEDEKLLKQRRIEESKETLKVRMDECMEILDYTQIIDTFNRAKIVLDIKQIVHGYIHDNDSFPEKITKNSESYIDKAKTWVLNFVFLTPDHMHVEGSKDLETLSKIYYGHEWQEKCRRMMLREMQREIDRRCYREWVSKLRSKPVASALTLRSKRPSLPLRLETKPKSNEKNEFTFETIKVHVA